MYAQRPAQSGALRRYAGFSAEEVAIFAGVDRTNASRDLNLLAQEGKIERIPGRPVLFVTRSASPEPLVQQHNNGTDHTGKVDYLSFSSTTSSPVEAVPQR